MEWEKPVRQQLWEYYLTEDQHEFSQTKSEVQNDLNGCFHPLHSSGTDLSFVLSRCNQTNACLLHYNDTGSRGPPAAFIYDTPVGSGGPARAVRKRLTWITAVTGQPTLTRPLVTTCENWPFLKATSILCHVENTMKILPLKHPLYLLKTNTPSKIENYTAPLYRNKGRVALWHLVTTDSSWWHFRMQSEHCWHLALLLF